MSIPTRRALKKRNFKDSNVRKFSFRWRPTLEVLEDRTLLSTSIPLSSQQWTAIGPADISNVGASGRITGVAADPTDPNTIYIAAAGGGVWKTVDAGKHWLPLTDNMPTLFMGAIAVSPSNPNVIYAGTGEANNSGDSFYGYGVLVSTDAGASWTLEHGPADPIAPAAPTLSQTSGGTLPAATYYVKIGYEFGGREGPGSAESSLVVAANNLLQVSSPASVPGATGYNVYVATASGNEAWQNTTPIALGTAWTEPTTGLLTGTAAPTDTDPNGAFYRKSVSKIAIDPTDPSVVYVAIADAGVNGLPGDDGIWRSTDYGATWTNTTATIPTNTIVTRIEDHSFTDVIIDPTTGGSFSNLTLYAAVGDFLGGDLGPSFNGIYKSTDGGGTWNELQGRLPTDSIELPEVGRISLAISKTNSPQTIYAIMSDSGFYDNPLANPAILRFGTLFKFMKSTDGGLTWADLTRNVPQVLGGSNVTPTANGQGWYDIAVAVDPNNGDHVFAGGSANGGKPGIVESFDGGNTWTSIVGTTHTDIHAFDFDANGKLLNGNDGGIWRLDSAAPGSISWSDLNSNLQITQFTGIALDPINQNVAYGGSQDNGTEKFNDNLGWNQVAGGDGGFVRVDGGHPNTVYHTFPFGMGFFQRSDDGGKTWTREDTGIKFTDGANFYPPYVIDPAESNRLLLGTDKVYETVTGGLPNPDAPWKNNGWVALSSGPLDPFGIVNAVAAAPSSVDTIYAGVQDFFFGSGILFGTTDHGATWNSLLTIPGGSISDVKVDPVNSQIVYVVSNSFDVPHVQRTMDGGKTWQDLSGNLPNIPVNSVLLDPWTRNLYVGTDAGTYASPFSSYNFSTSPNWVFLKIDQPKAQVVDLELSTVQLQLNTRGYILGEGTHGRGMFELETTHFTQTNGPSTAVTAGTPFQFTINALDLFDQPIQGYTGVYTGTVHITSSDNQFSPFDYSFTTQDNDTHTFTVILKTAGAQTVMVTDAADAVDPISIPVQINAAAASLLRVTGPAQATAGASFSITVTALDAFNNVAPTYAGTVHFTTMDSQTGVILPGDYTFVPAADNGSHTFSGANGVTLDTAGNQSVFATDTVTPSIAGVAVVNVIPGAASHLAVMAPTTAPAGSTITLTINALDPFANIAPTYRGQVHFTTSDKGFAVLVPGDYTFTAGDAGTHTFPNLTSLDTSGNQTITATDTVTSSITGTATVAVTAGTISHLTLITPPSVIANIPFTVAVQARDRFENVVPTFSDTVTFTVTDPSPLKVLPAPYTFMAGDAGSHTFTNGFTLITAGLQTITAKDNAFATIKGTVTLTVGNPLPVIMAVSPQTVMEQNGVFTLTVNGIGFVPSSVVDWNGTALTTTFINGGTLQAAVPAANVAEENLAAVTVVNPTPGGGTSNIQPYTIGDASLNATVSPITGTEGAAFSGQIISFMDSNLKAPLSDFTTNPGGVSINWGDNSTSIGSVTQPGGPGTAFVVTAGHIYTEEGSFTATATVTDLGGGTTMATGTATIGDAGLTGNANSIQVVRDVVFSGTVASFTDANPTAPLSDFMTAPGGVTIAWGDGTTSPGTVTQPGGPGSAFLVSGSHTFSNPGSETMMVTITDSGGSVIAPTANVQVIKRFDIAGRSSKTGQIFVGASDGSSSFTTSVWGSWSTAVTWVDVQSGDFNGDGRADIVGRVAESGDWWVALSNGTSFTNVHFGAWAARPGVTWVDVHVGDFLGNGKDDIVGRWLETGQWWMAESTGTSFTNVLLGTWNPGVVWTDVNVGDFNGDHKTDITGRAALYGQWWTSLSNGTSFSTSLWASWNPTVTWVDVKVGDFNGDGKADIVGRYAAAGAWFVGLSTGTSFNTTLWATWNPGVTWVDVNIGDFNGDGKSDIIGRYLQGGVWYVGQSTGASFNTTAWAFWNPSVSWVNVEVGDFNSDGKSDITAQVAGAGQWWTGVSNGSAFSTSLWGSWPANFTWVDVHADNYAL